MNKFFGWILKYRKPIGYVIGALNLLCALNYALMGQIGNAVLWGIIGAYLIFDAYESD